MRRLMCVQLSMEATQGKREAVDVVAILFARWRSDTYILRLHVVLLLCRRPSFPLVTRCVS